MGDLNQYEWVRRHLDVAQGPVLEIGSRFYRPETSLAYRSLMAGRGSYLGTDVQEGGNVDVVADLTVDFDELPAALREEQFKTILCMSVMEHVRDIYAFSRNVARLAAPGSRMFLSVPWVWRFHGYPSDYWRFSPEALKFLFPGFKIDEKRSCLQHQQPGRYLPYGTKQLGIYPDYRADTAPSSRLGRGVQELYGRFTRKFTPGFAARDFNVLYPTMINACFVRDDTR